MIEIPHRDQIDSFQIKLKSKKLIEVILKKYVYNTQENHGNNMKNLCQLLKTNLSLKVNSALKSFQKYLSNDYNIPIEVNFTPLRYQQLCSIVQEWSAYCTDPPQSTFHIRMNSIHHRNQLFRNIFLDQSANITSYFESLNQDSMLKGFDIYPLLADLLSSEYFLYEYKNDNEIFFEKVGSFNKFIEIVEKFQKSSNRIIDENQQNIDYIRRYQFEKLIEFWQHQNIELELTINCKKNHTNKSIQIDNEKQINNITRINNSTQTLNFTKNLTQIIHQTLKDLNILTESQNDSEKLKSIERMYQFFRNEKILILEQNNNKNVNKNQCKNNNNNSNISNINNINNNNNNNNYNNNNNSNNTNKKQLKNNIPKEQPSLIVKINSDYQKQKHLKNNENIYLQQQDRIRIQDKNNRNRKISSNQNTLIDVQTQRTMRTSPSNILFNSKEKIIKENDHKTYCEKKNTSLRKSNNYLSPSKVVLTHPKQSKYQSFLRKQSFINNIYQYYSRKNLMTLQSLHQFLCEFGIIQDNEAQFIFKILQQRLIGNVNDVTKNEFLKIIKILMQENEQFDLQMLQQFFKTCCCTQQNSSQNSLIDYSIKHHQQQQQQQQQQSSIIKNYYKKNNNYKSNIRNNKRKIIEKQSEFYQKSNKNYNEQPKFKEKSNNHYNESKKIKSRHRLYKYNDAYDEDSYR